MLHQLGIHLTVAQTILALVVGLGLVGMMGMAFTGFEADNPVFTSPGGKLKSIDGGTIASVAGTIVPTAYQQVVSGTAAITGIQLPYDGFEGTIVFMPSGIFTWTAAGNIALAGTAVVGKALYFNYSQRTSKWYPSYIA